MSQLPMLYLFDVDGTLLLSGGAGSAALDLVFERRYGLRDAMARVSLGGKTDPMIIAEVFELHWSRPPAHEEVVAILEDYVPCLHDALARSTRFRLMPAVIETLDFLAAQPNVHLGVATGNIQSGARAKLERAGLWQRFRHGGFGDDAFEHSDPGASGRALLVERAIGRACDMAGHEFAREHIIVVGDTQLDVLAARACGVRVAAVATGSVDRATLEATEPDAVFDTLAELPAWHQQLASIDSM